MPAMRFALLYSSRTLLVASKESDRLLRMTQRSLLLINLGAPDQVSWISCVYRVTFIILGLFGL